MEWEVEYTDEFSNWRDSLSETEQEDVAAAVEMLEIKGPQLPFPYSSGINGSKHTHMRELRIQHEGWPYRTLYAFDPRCMAISNRWYEENVSKADKLYDEHLQSLKEEENGKRI